MKIEVKNDAMLGRTNNTTLHIELMKLQQENQTNKTIIEIQVKRIYELEQENKLLKEKINLRNKEKTDICNKIRNQKEKAKRYRTEITNLIAKNKQLKDNWNELKKYLEENLYFYSGYQGEDREEDISIKYVIDKIKELEEGE